MHVYLIASAISEVLCTYNTLSDTYQKVVLAMLEPFRRASLLQAAKPHA
jgi:hypothetical protein